ncbi:DoxX family protein [Antarcticibacterium flavum]|uniref:DoxX family protein n=1 Tax=Antarcticibacterium flavum TaxID=2058175 RepID=A0A5B7WYP6_9FLAO|nr:MULTISPECIES: DoxX family protein [Antarcticibacterium]MCM4158933.1 DoxX family protein [Antarcticibacterium sp. W02-3]QCY68187.1 DoxX family protein [Antarcticibacterium flavum]
MKKSYSTILELPQVDFGLLIFRLGISGLMLTHGIPKLITFFGSEPITFADPIGIGEVASFTFAVFAEFVCSILVILGLGTRLAVIPLIATMAVAALIVHWTDGFGSQELPLLFLFGYLLLFFTGGGKYSLDWYILSSKKK